MGEGGHDRWAGEPDRWRWPVVVLVAVLHLGLYLLLRSAIGMVEPVFGITKEQKHFRRFLLRGIEKVEAEWSFACATFNLWRMSRRGYKPQMA